MGSHHRVCASSFKSRHNNKTTERMKLLSSELNTLHFILIYTNIEHRRTARTSLSQLHLIFGQLFLNLSFFEIRIDACCSGYRGYLHILPRWAEFVTTRTF